MARTKGDIATIDLLDWQPPSPVQRFDDDQVRGSSICAMISRAVSVALKEATRSREEIADDMSAFLGEKITTNMLDAYASQARESHKINVARWLALISATGDMRLLNIGADMFDHAVIPNRFIAAIEEAQVADQIDQLEQRRSVARRSWKGAAK